MTERVQAVARYKKGAHSPRDRGWVERGLVNSFQKIGARVVGPVTFTEYASVDDMPAELSRAEDCTPDPDHDLVVLVAVAEAEHEDPARLRAERVKQLRAEAERRGAA